jgi:diphosphomevalonate decarboxylase
MEAIAQAQPNIALVKYWGKREVDRNVPAVPSLSITLDSLWTRTQVAFDPKLGADDVSINGRRDASQSARVSALLDTCRKWAGVALHAHVDSKTNFPIGAGLASSASGFAALAAAAVSALEIEIDANELSALARRASGSAARSIFGGFVEMPDTVSGAVTAQPLLAASDWPLQVIIALTSEQPKPTGSSDGMRHSAETSDYYDAWVDSAGRDFTTARDAVIKRDFATLAEVSEHSCMKMHAVMMSSNPPLIYWNGATVDCIHTIRRLRDDGIPTFFTVDAGPQVKAVCLPEYADVVRAALRKVSGVTRLYTSNLGPGVRIMESMQ